MVDVNKEISDLRQIPMFGKYLGNALKLLQDGINGLGINVGADPTQTLPAPPAIQGLNVKTDGNGTVHAVINDSSAIQRGVHYFVEYQQLQTGKPLTFSQPHVVHLGTSRTMHPLVLPAKDDAGNAVHYIFQAYSQYPGGEPGEKVRFGGTTPTAVSPGGTVKMTLLPSTGSGTAQASGEQAGSGFGKVLFRPVVAAKRSGR